MDLRERVARLTPRQRECLYLVHEGYSQKAVAAALGLSLDMVKEHLEGARRTLGVDKSMRAARILVEETGIPPSMGGVERGVVPPPPDPASIPPSAQSDEPEAPGSNEVHEPQAVYLKPVSQSQHRPFPWPFPGQGRRWNDVGPFGKLIQILLCAFVLGAIALVLWGLIHGTKQVISDILI